jgi:DNA-binding MarR family transcriptional regulator
MPQPRLPRLDPIAEARRQWDEHGWTDAGAGMAMVTSVMRVQQMLLARMDEVLAPFELTFARYELLMLLSFTRTGSLPLGKIGERLQVHPTSVTSAVGRLEGQGLVERKPHPTDGRATLVEITPSGRNLVEKATREVNEQVFTQLPLEGGDVEALASLLERYRRNAGDIA